MHLLFTFFYLFWEISYHRSKIRKFRIRPEDHKIICNCLCANKIAKWQEENQNYWLGILFRECSSLISNAPSAFRGRLFIFKYLRKLPKGPFNKYVDKMRDGEGGQKETFFGPLPHPSSCLHSYLLYDNILSM